MSDLGRRDLMLRGAAALTCASAGAAGAAFAVQPQYAELGQPGDAARLAGTITYSGNGVDVPSFPVIKDHAICGHGERSPKALRLGENNQFADCVVEIKGVPWGKAWDPVFNNGKIYQIDCSFQPHVQIIRSNAFVEVFNYDPILHNIHAYEVHNGTRRSMFSFAQPEVGQVNRIDLKFRRGNLLMIDCNAHNWMAGWVYTSSSPYLAVTSLDGRFDIPDVPPGQYELSVWHPLLGTKTAALNLAPNANLDLDLNLA